MTDHISNAVLDMPNFSTGAGTAADQWVGNGGANQRWNLTETALPTLTTGQYRT